MAMDEETARLKHIENQTNYKRRLRSKADLPIDGLFDPPKKVQTPLEYMLGVMNDPNEAPLRRDRMAIIAAQYVHPNASKIPEEKLGKKEQQAVAASEASNNGVFATLGPPNVIN